MRINTLEKIKIYKKNSLYADFLFSYPSTYILKNTESHEEEISYIWENWNLLYVHIPFCFEICTFCNVNKTKLNNYDEVEKYLNTLFQEIDYYSQNIWKNILFEWIYIWWWTPTTLKGNDLKRLFNKIFDSFNFEKNFSFEIDAHPTTLTEKKIKILSEFWVDQISMWIQSMEPEVMSSINRKAQSFYTLEKLSHIFKNYSFKLHFDFIIWLPNESIDQLEKDVCYIAEKFEPYSISINWYDNTVDTKLFTTHKEDFRTTQYKNQVRKNVQYISDLLKDKYGITRKLTFYFDWFFKKLHNVIWLWSGSYWYVKWNWVYKNQDYQGYIENFKNKKGIKFSKIDEKIMYLIHNYDDERLNNNYYLLFNSYIYNDFKDSIDYFISKSYASITDNEVLFTFKNNSIAQFELIELYSDNILQSYE